MKCFNKKILDSKLFTKTITLKIETYLKKIKLKAFKKIQKCSENFYSLKVLQTQFKK